MEQATEIADAVLGAIGQRLGNPEDVARELAPAARGELRAAVEAELQQLTKRQTGSLLRSLDLPSPDERTVPRPRVVDAFVDFVAAHAEEAVGDGVILRGAARLRIATFNVADSPYSRGSLVGEKARAVGEAIGRAGVDIVALQEVGDRFPLGDACEAAQRVSGVTWRVISTNADPFEGHAFMWREDRARAEMAAPVVLDGAAGIAGFTAAGLAADAAVCGAMGDLHRYPAAARFSVDGSVVSIVSVHRKCSLTEADMDRRANAAFHGFLDHVAAAPGTDLLLVAGDFNFYKREDKLRALTYHDVLRARWRPLLALGAYKTNYGNQYQYDNVLALRSQVGGAVTALAPPAGESESAFWAVARPECIPPPEELVQRVIATEGKAKFIVSYFSDHRLVVTSLAKAEPGDVVREARPVWERLVGQWAEEGGASSPAAAGGAGEAAEEAGAAAGSAAGAGAGAGPVRATPPARIPASTATGTPSRSESNPPSDGEGEGDSTAGEGNPAEAAATPPSSRARVAAQQGQRPTLAPVQSPPRRSSSPPSVATPPAVTAAAQAPTPSHAASQGRATREALANLLPKPVLASLCDKAGIRAGTQPKPALAEQFIGKADAGLSATAGAAVAAVLRDALNDEGVAHTRLRRTCRATKAETDTACAFLVALRAGPDGSAEDE